MKRIWCAWAIVAIGGACPTIQAADDAKAIITKGVAALGGEAKLGKAKALKWKAETKLTIEGNDHDMVVQHASQGLDQSRSLVQGEINGNEIKVTTVLDGKKGWRTFPETNPLDADGVENEKRNLYLQVVPITLVPLLGKDFQVELLADEKVADKPARVLKVTGPEGKTFRLLFDQTSGLPVKMVATVVGFSGDDYDQITFFKNYKEMGGIQKASVVEVLRNGDPFLSSLIKDFQTLESLPADTFAEPK